MPYWILLLLLYILNTGSAKAEYKQQQQRERDESERVSAQGTRGCPFEQGELYLYSPSDKYLMVNPLRPQILLHVTPPNSKTSQSPQQIVKISLVDSESKETKFIQEYEIQGTSNLLISPNIILESPHVLSAGLICNSQRPSTTKSLRILLVPDEKN